MAGHHVRLGIFSPSVLLGVAAATGALDRAGLLVEEIPVDSSSHQFRLLDEGGLDAALTSPDNVLAYRGSTANPLERPVEVRVLAAIDRGLGLSLFRAPGADPGRLRGGVLAVDVPTSGFAFVGYELAARQGLRRGYDYQVRAFGATPRRADALIAGDCAMTVLNAGSDLRAEAAGCVRVSRATSLGDYLGTVLVAPESAGDETPALRALVAAVLATSRRLAGGELRSLALAVTEERLGLTGALATRHLATLADPVEGLVPDGLLDGASLDTLRWLRWRYAEAPAASAWESL